MFDWFRVRGPHIICPFCGDIIYFDTRNVIYYCEKCQKVIDPMGWYEIPAKRVDG